MPLPKKPKDFKANAAAEKKFAQALRRVGQHVGHLVETHVEGSKLVREREMVRRLQDYAETLGPWAERQAAKMLEKVSSKNKTAWTKNSREMGRLIRSTVAESATGAKITQLMRENVALIQTLPLRAGARAQTLALEAQYDGSRASEVAEELMRSGKVAESDAVRIARTETARASSIITETRARASGSSQYIWRNSGDASVREAHRKYHGKNLDGMVFDWDHPPTLDDGTTGHPGTFPNCRCYPEPFFPKT